VWRANGAISACRRLFRRFRGVGASGVAVWLKTPKIGLMGGNIVVREKRKKSVDPQNAVRYKNAV